MKEINLNDFVICKIRAWDIYLDDRNTMKKVFENGGIFDLPSKVVGYVVGQYDKEKKEFNIGISLVSENDMNKNCIFADAKIINVKKSLEIAINKLKSKKVNTSTYTRLADKQVFFSYGMTRVMKYTLGQTVAFVVNKMMKRDNITDINANQIKVKF